MYVYDVNRCTVGGNPFVLLGIPIPVPTRTNSSGPLLFVKQTIAIGLVMDVGAVRILGVVGGCPVNKPLSD